MPERLIQTAKGTEEKLRNMDPTKTFSNNPLEVLETNMCMTCEEKEMCGFYATTRAMEKEKERKRDSEQELTKNGTEAGKYTVGDRKQVWKILRENETYRAMRKRIKKNLFDGSHEYKLTDEGLNKEDMKWATSETLRTTRMLAIGRYIIKWIGTLKGWNMSLENARIEMWRKMII